MGTASFGTLLKVGDGGGPEAFTTIAEVRDIGGPRLSMATADVTHQSSPGGFREKVGTLLDGGQVTFDINYLPGNATHDASTGLVKDMTDKTKRNFELIFPDAASTKWSFTALVVGFEPSEPVDGALTASLTLDITGQPTLA